VRESDVHKTDLSRRRLAQALGAGATLGVLGACATTEPAPSSTKKLGRVLVVGAGYGGATAAKYLKHWGGPGIEVVLIDREPRFVSCPLSNLVLGGSRRIDDLAVSYQGLRERGVLVLNDEVESIDVAKKQVVLKKIQNQSFDRIVVSPGIDFNFGAVQGLDAEAQKTILHAWKAGPQTVALRAQLEAMPDGGVYVLTIPLAPYRCPPGPYERACQVAHYFKTAKPRSKVIVLDANPEITSKKALFTKVFEETYKGIVDYRPQSNVTEIDARSRTAITELGDRVKADVLNVVPPQAAAELARKAGLVNANNRWCQVDWVTMESTAAAGVHVLGDATFPAPAMPKSGHMANQHGKTAAAAIVEILNGRAPQPTMMANTCYSFVDDRNVIHVASVHRYVAEKKTMETVPGSGGVSAAPNLLEGVYANAWAQNIWRDMFS
jgi:sulfite dehydrogenase